MNIVIRAGRAYWRLNEAAWRQLRRAAWPLIVVIGGASLAAWAVGATTGDPVLVWAPAVYVWLLVLSYALARRLP